MGLLFNLAQRWATTDERMEKLDNWLFTLDRYVWDPLYVLKCRLWHRHNVIKVPTLPPTWNDHDRLMLHACFHLLVDFVENSQTWELYHEYTMDGECEVCDKPMRPDRVHASILAYEETRDYDRGALRAYEWAAVSELYYWWKEHREETTEYKAQTDKLKQLVLLRQLLWT